MGVHKLDQHQNKKAVLTVDGKNYEFPTTEGTEGEKAIDISQLRAQTGYVTLDNAYMNTAGCESKITYLDGENGILKYRGYKIEDLAEKSNFMEVSYLLMYGKLPTSKELETFEKRIEKYSESPALIKDLVKRFPKNAHPVGVLSSLIVALSSVNENFNKQDLNPQEQDEVSAQLLAQIKNCAAYFHKVSQGQELVDSKHGLNYCQDFLNMTFGDNKHAPAADQVIVDALEVLFILHADHEQNCSTSSVRLVGSSKANPYATISGGINALWGPLHGGANQAVVEMLEAIQKDGGGYKKFINKAKDKSDNFVLMGFGHRVYKNFDPRAKIIKKACDSVLNKLGIKDPLLDIAKGLEEAALSDPYFIERKLYPNVDFYSGIIYRALGIPTSMFTVMFAMGRLPGWLSQWREMLSSPGMKIGRPRQIYTGETDQKYVEIKKR